MTKQDYQQKALDLLTVSPLTVGDYKDLAETLAENYRIVSGREFSKTCPTSAPRKFLREWDESLWGGSL